MAEIILTRENFEAEVEKSSVPVMVDFWATWCAPCRVQGPIVEGLAHEFEGKNIKIAKLNVDEAREIAQKYGILSIPTLMIFKDGKEHDSLIGLQDKEVLVAKIKELIA